MSLKLDVSRAAEAGGILLREFNSSGREIPEDTPPQGVERGSSQHLLWLALTSSVDYMRDATKLWHVSRAAFVSHRYLFDPAKVVEAGLSRVKEDVKTSGISFRPDRDGDHWFRICASFHSSWNDDPMELVKANNYLAPGIILTLREFGHDGEALFPNLRGRKISSMWVRMLRDNAKLELQDLGQVDIPVDVHVLRATLTTGALRGSFRGDQEDIYPLVRLVWKQDAENLSKQFLKEFIALDFDEPLWRRSMTGCTHRKGSDTTACRNGCPIAQLCVPGKIKVGKEFEVET